jgi:hypothetical protein
MLAFGIFSLLLTAGVLSMINRRTRDFNLKMQRRDIRLVDIPKGRPAVARPALEPSAPAAPVRAET